MDKFKTIVGQIKIEKDEDGYHVHDDECFICGTLGINEEKFNDLTSKSNENEKLKAALRGKENEIDVLKWRVKYLSQFKPKEHKEGPDAEGTNEKEV